MVVGLRRVLLSSLEGSAVTQIKLHGAQHEFSTIPGVVEDLTDIVLNIKSLVVKNYSENQTRVVRVEKNTAGVVTGADIEPDDQVEVINKDHVIATLTEDVPFILEMVVENGRGYVPANEHTPHAQEIGIIPIDAAFSPDGRRVITASKDGTVRIWRFRWEDLLEYLDESTRVCLSVQQRVEFLQEEDNKKTDPAFENYDHCLQSEQDKANRQKS